jgi:hypothetical protein
MGNLGGIRFCFYYVVLSNSLFPIYLFSGRARKNEKIHSIFKSLDGHFFRPCRLSSKNTGPGIF